MILGLVLAGGASRRFGSDKAHALLGGRPLIGHAIDALRPHVAALVVAGPAVMGLARVEDRPRAGLGPLGGLAGALAHAADGGFDRVLSLPCDTPVLPDGLLATLATTDAPVALAGLPVCGLWPAALGPALERHLTESGDRSVRGWMASIGARALPHPPIANVNTLAELRALQGGGA